MLKRVAHSLGLVECSDKKNQLRGSKASPDLLSSQSNGFSVRVIHAGGQQEVYKHALPASKLMTKYPGMCIAWREVFKVPHQSVLWQGELLLPGHKYILISSRQVEKLKIRHPEKGETEEPNGVVAEEILDIKTSSPSGHKHKENDKIREPNGGAGQEILETRTRLSPSGCKSQENSEVEEAKKLGEEVVNTKMDISLDGGVGEETFYSAKDFYVSKEEWKRSSRQKRIKGKKIFVPPLPKGRQHRILGWQPSLPTVKELSP